MDLCRYRREMVCRTATRSLGGGAALAQRFEAADLVGKELPLLVTADKHLEHGVTVAVEELDRAGPPAKERPIDEIDPRAPVYLQMPADGARPVDIEVPACMSARRKRRFGFEDAVLRVHDEHYRAPACEVFPNRVELRGWCSPALLRRQAIEDGAIAYAVRFRQAFENAIRLLRESRLDSGYRLTRRHDRALMC